MRLTINVSYPELGDDQDQLLTLEIFPEMTITILKDSIQSETQIPPEAQHLYHNGRLVTIPSKTLAELGVIDGDMLALHVRNVSENSQRGASRRQAQNTTQSVQHDPEFLRMQILGSPELREQLRRAQPALADVLENPEQFRNIIMQNANRDNDERLARQDQVNQLNADPFDAESQARIEEMIRQERVMENLQNAMEYNPEVFGRVHMLYLDVEINGKKVKAMVDSGAQATIMSPSCAEECGIMRLVDKRFSGIARGVGTANIIGRVHLFQIKIGTLFLPCSFTVMEGKAVDLLLGLDMLKRHQATIDLARDRLVIQGEEIPFLSEAEIPKDLGGEAEDEEAKVSGPAGTTIDSRSGAVSAPSGSASALPTAVATSPAPAPAVTQVPVRSSGGFPEEHVEQLMALGFDRAGAINALQAAGGNVEVAAGLLFGA